MNRLFPFSFLLIFAIQATMPTPLLAQKPTLSYYLPDIPYNPAIPTPESFFGYQVGEWHISHDQLVGYMKALDAASSRLTLTEYARTHENRPLLHLTVTSEKNHARIDEIKSQHRQLNDPARSAGMDVSGMPLVLYQGFSIHGNEPSGGNASALVAYYLAAGQSEDLHKLLEGTVILLDPCFNPDGFNRFASWVNVHKNKNMTPDPQDREYNETWPGGRTNHYWFDLNRDWLPAVHPESQGRLKLFHDWKPNVLTDHHEMGTNATYFFMPGEPERVNALTPQRNQDFTSKFAEFHAEALDKIGSLYYTREGFDDFFIGKGSTYPDVNGCIGILFEQASSRGHMQQSENGVITFPFTIRNQVTTALSTQRAAVAMRTDLLSFQRDFYKTAMEEARADSHRAYVFGDPYDAARTAMFVELLRRHQIDVYQLGNNLNAGGQRFDAKNSYVVPLEQSQYRLIRGIFETNTNFKDSLFYDISSWTLPLAYNIPAAAIDRKSAPGNLLGTKVEMKSPELQGMNNSEYAYLFEWDDYFAPRALNYLLINGLRAKVSSEPFVSEGRPFSRGSILVPAKGQDKDPDAVFQLMKNAAIMSGVSFYSAKTGLTPEGSDLGSNRFRPLQKPKVMLVIGDGVTSSDAGEAWHLLDQRYNVTVTKVEAEDMGRFDLDKYNVMIMVDGSYSTLNSAGTEKLKQWVAGGGTLIAMEGAVQWLKNAGIAYAKWSEDKAENDKTPARKDYNQLSLENGVRSISGAIFEAEGDLTHPLLYGFKRNKFAVFRRGSFFMESAQNPYATPLVHTANPLLSGYVNQKNLQRIKNSAVVVVSGLGSGRVICFADNPNFRGFWYGTNRLFANAVFFGNTISNGATEKAPKPEAKK
mgnify:CR=1 FL=1